MKAIIDGVRYDTEKAKPIGTGSYGSYPGSGDFSHWTADLYVTESQRYFLAGEGGGMTQFAHRRADGGSCGGSKLIPLLSKDEASRWAERHLDSETVEEYFGEMIEDA